MAIFNFAGQRRLVGVEATSARLSRSGFRASRFDWIVVIFVVLVQLGAVVTNPLLRDSLVGSVDNELQNPVNTGGVALSFVLLGIVSISHFRQIGLIASRNAFPLLYVLLVFSSLMWSIQPDATLRRAIGYGLTMFIAAYLPARFSINDVMKALSISFALSAIASILFILIWPEHGIMQIGDLRGNWQGIFAHKNQLGGVMALGVFTELFLLVAKVSRRYWHFALFVLFFMLVLLSRATTSLLVSTGYVLGTCIYLLWRREKLAGLVASIVAILFLSQFLFLLWYDSEFAFGLLGKDATLTGRTGLWEVILPLIEEKPLLGWGYGAVWQANTTVNARVDQLVGWAVSSSHNGFVDIALELGLVGSAIMLIICVVALWRSFRCCVAGFHIVGWFSLMYISGTIATALTGETLGQNQDIGWVVFNVLMVSCGLILNSHRGCDATEGQRKTIHVHKR